MGWTELHPWFAAIGLSLDMIGFVFLIAEWRQAFQQTKESEFQTELQKASGADWGKTPEEIARLVPGIRAHIETQFRARSLRFYVGASLIMTGFALQLIGSIPQPAP